MGNLFSKKMINKSNEELLAILQNKKSFDERAVLAATWELDKRDISTDYSKQLQETINSKIRIQKENQQNSPTIPKYVIFLVSFLFTPIFGSILLIINIVELKNWKAVWIVILFVVLYTALSLFIYNLFEYHASAIIITNAVGSTIVSELLWHKFVRKNEDTIETSNRN